MRGDATPPPFPLLEELVHASARYLEALTILDSAALAEPSALPGWTRAHVVGHLSRSADGMRRVLDQAAAGRPATMYDSDSSRAADIDDTVARLDRAGLLADARESSERLERAFASYDGPRDVTYARTPAAADEGRITPLGRLDLSRWTEVEIHHADLLLDYQPSAWPESFSRRLLDRRQGELAGVDGPAMILSATDVEGIWTFGGDGGPQISGAVGDLAWWLTGRGHGVGLTSSTGELPTIPRWL